MRPGRALTQAIDRAYEAFGAYGPPSAAEVAAHSDIASRMILGALLSAPLRLLTVQQIGNAALGLPEAGSVKDYKHCLPRILEDAVRGAVYLGTMPPIIAGKLKMAEWLAWPEAEQAAVRALFNEAWA